MRSLSTGAGVVLLMSVVLGCGGELTRPDPPDDVQAFVREEGLPNLRVIETVFARDDHTLFFRVEYGTQHDCRSGCFYSSALGLRLLGRIGWVRIEDYEGLDTSGFSHFDVQQDDAPLFDASLWVELELADTWAHWAALLPMLAADVDTPAATLLEIAKLLHEFISKHIAWNLLENPSVSANPEILEVLATLPEFRGDPYALARQEARDLLGQVE